MSQPRKKKSGLAPHAAMIPPIPLKRPPNTSLQVGMDELDGQMTAALEAVIRRILDQIKVVMSVESIKVLGTRAHMLLAMQSTHRSIRRLVRQDSQDMDLSVDALPLTRVQLERCFLALLIQDNPDRWHKRYRKNAWKTFAEKFFRDQTALGHLEPFKPHFASDGAGVGLLRAFAREMGVWEDEFQTVRILTTGDKPDRRWPMRYIAQMPTPGRTIELLEDPGLKRLASVVYPYYDSLSHFSHGGMVGVMSASVLRPESAAFGSDADKQHFFLTSIVEKTLPLSYVSVLITATLFAAGMGADQEVRDVLRHAWQPYHSDGSPMGVAVWDEWAAALLDADWPLPAKKARAADHAGKQQEKEKGFTSQKRG
ncbi:MAG: hypothetical protein HZA50_19390 [Planctomycetes bacterium]|nr:hypothetical protein [Planctomycetota bacterium]